MENVFVKSSFHIKNILKIWHTEDFGYISFNISCTGSHFLYELNKQLLG